MSEPARCTMADPAPTDRCVAVIAPRWSMMNVAGVALTHRLAGVAVRIVVERDAAPPALEPQWHALGAAHALEVVDDLTAHRGPPPAAVLLVGSQRATAAERSRLLAVREWCERQGLATIEASLAADAFTPGWDMSTLAWRHVFEAGDQSRRSAAPA